MLFRKIKKKLGGKSNKRMKKMRKKLGGRKPSKKQLKKILRRIRQGKTKVMMLTFRANINAFTKARLNYIRSSLAKILRISLRLVSRPTIMAGSVVLRVVLPVAAANKLSAMIASGKLKNIGGIGVSKAKVSRSRAKMLPVKPKKRVVIKRAPRSKYLTPKIFRYRRRGAAGRRGAQAPAPVACASGAQPTTVTVTTIVNQGGAAAACAGNGCAKPCPAAAPKALKKKKALVFG